MLPLMVIVPTRGRPGNARRLMRTFQGSDDAMLVLVVDDDDASLPDYRSLVSGYSWDNVRLVVAPRGRPGIVDPLNHVTMEILEEYPDLQYIGFMGDDHLPHGDNWAVEICLALANLGTGVVYGDDLLQGEKLATAAFLTADIPRALGYMAPPELIHLWVDNYWMHIGKGIGRLKYLPNVIIEHLHPLNGKSEWDSTYAECNDQTTVAGPDYIAFHAMLENGRLAEDVAKVQAVMNQAD